jgi:hypothetical protein
MIFHNLHLFFFVKTFIFRFLYCYRFILIVIFLLILQVFCLSNWSWSWWAVRLICLFLFWIVVTHWCDLMSVMNGNKLFYIRRFSIRSRWQRVSIRWIRRIFLFSIIINHLRKIKPFRILLFFNHRSIVTYLFNTCLRSFWTNRNLLILKFKICFNNPLNSSHIWIAINMKWFNVLRNMIWTFPLLYPFEKTKINN